jgi:hypothetical protein
LHSVSFYFHLVLLLILKEYLSRQIKPFSVFRLIVAYGLFIIVLSMVALRERRETGMPNPFKTVVERSYKTTAKLIDSLGAPKMPSADIVQRHASVLQEEFGQLWAKGDNPRVLIIPPISLPLNEWNGLLSGCRLMDGETQHPNLPNTRIPIVRSAGRVQLYLPPDADGLTSLLKPHPVSGSDWDVAVISGNDRPPLTGIRVGDVLRQSSPSLNDYLWLQLHLLTDGQRLIGDQREHQPQLLTVGQPMVDHHGSSTILRDTVTVGGRVQSVLARWNTAAAGIDVVLSNPLAVDHSIGARKCVRTSEL